MSSSRNIVIIGGGVSGLSAAYYLSKSGIRATLIEAQPSLGGTIRTESIDGCTVEGGPDSFLAAKPWALDLIRDLGLEDQVIGSRDSLRRTLIWKGERLVPFPDGMQLMVPTRIGPVLSSRLLSARTKWRMGMDLFRRPRTYPDRSVSEFIGDHFGQEAVDYIAEPLLAGVYGGDPAELSAPSVLPKFVEYESKYGSLSRGVIENRKRSEGPIFQTLKDGLGQWIDALRGKLDPASIIQGRAETVEPGRVRVNGEWLAADQTILACGANVSASLLTGALSSVLSAIPYSSAVIVALGFRRSAFQHPAKGFGFLVPKRERKRLMACTWVGNKFPFRTPDDMTLLRCFFGGNPAEGDEQMVAWAMEELGTILGLRAQPVFSRVNRWPNSMPQYTVGHASRMAELQHELRGRPGLHLIGNAYSGIGLPDCVRLAKQTAESIIASPYSPEASS